MTSRHSGAYGSRGPAAISKTLMFKGRVRPRLPLRRGQEDSALHQGDHLGTMAELHWRFERIHPFSDGNGRVGRAILFKESLRSDETPFIVTEDLREFHIRGLRNYPKEHWWLVDAFGTCQDRFAASYLPLLRSYERAIQAFGIERNESLDEQAQAPAPRDDTPRAGDRTGPRR